MKRQSKIVWIYSGVALASVAMILLFRSVGAAAPSAAMPEVSDVGKEHVTTFFPIANDIDLVNQTGGKVKLSDIRGEVTVIAQFFAICPQCAVRNGMELGELYRSFRGDPDFRIVCLTVDPESDGPGELAAYGKALGADPANWWFASAGDATETHAYLEEELKFFRIQERRDPVDIASNGRFAHDLAFLLVDRDFNVIGKWPLAEARSEEARRRDPEMYSRLKDEMYARIRDELDKR